jgi:hypothetical protein
MLGDITDWKEENGIKYALPFSPTKEKHDRVMEIINNFILNNPCWNVMENDGTIIIFKYIDDK